MKVSPFAGKPAGAGDAGGRAQAHHGLLCRDARSVGPGAAGCVRHLGPSRFRVRTRPSTNGTSWPSARRSACTASGRRSTARCSSAWTRMRFPCRPLPARSRCWRPTAWKSCSRKATNIRPTPAVSHAILTLQPRAQDAACRRHRHHALAQSARRTAGSSTTRPTAGRRRPPSPAGSRPRPTSCSKPACEGVKRIPFEKALRAATTHRHDYLNAYVGDLGNVIDMEAIRGAKISLGVDPLGGAGRPLLGADCRALRVEPHGRQRGRRPDLPVHDGGLGRPDPHGPVLALCHAAVDRPEGPLRHRLRLRHRPRPARDCHPERRSCCRPITTFPPPSSISSSTGRSGARTRRSARRW